jgi:diacylglycerol kinase
VKKRIESFKYAFQGGAALVSTQANARLHLLATILVCGLAIMCRITALEWMALVMVIALVWIAEALNTAIEFLADEVTLERKPRIRQAKDISAFAVLVAAFCAAIVGALIFIPHLPR